MWDLNIYGFSTIGPATPKEYSINLGDWEIIDIPFDVDKEEAKRYISNFLDKIVAIEMPTSLQCNLRCKYCYITNPKYKNTVVKSSQIEKIINNVKNLLPNFKENSKEKIYFTPWGAEPLININTIEVIYNKIKEFNYKNVTMNFSTNATILNEKVKDILYKLIDKDIIKDIQVSIDGPPDIQNYYRPFLNDSPSFDSVVEFVKWIKEIEREKKKKILHFCSTIYLRDENFINDWYKATDFFSDKDNELFFTQVMPSRMSGEDLTNDEMVEIFVEAMRQSTDLLTKKAKNQNIGLVDFYTNKLFGIPSACSRTAYPYCSALNTQIAIDLDGSLYPCHGPITNPINEKPWVWFGNIFEKKISYRRLKRAIFSLYGGTIFKGKCNDCIIYQLTRSPICWSCYSHNLAVSNEPLTDSIYRCFAFNKSFKYWLIQALVSIENSYVFPLLTKKMIEFLGIEKIESNVKNKISYKTSSKYTYGYDGVLVNACKKMEKNISFGGYVSEWWRMDDFN